MVITKFLKIVINKVLDIHIVSRWLINNVLELHSTSYKLASIIAVKLEGGRHPKHNIINYGQWFTSNISKNDIVLDIGCNTGMMVDKLSEKAEYVYGIEINERLVNEAKFKIQKNNVEFICSDATVYDYSKCRDITIVTLSNVLEHIEYRVDFLLKIIEQIPWSSKDRKKLLIRVPMVDRDWITIYKKQIGVEYRLDNTHYTEYTYLQFKDELNKSDIKIVSYHIQFGELYAVCEAI